jgi:hypothetical protein
MPVTCSELVLHRFNIDFSPGGQEFFLLIFWV